MNKTLDVTIDSAERDAAFASFVQTHPAWQSTQKLDELRATDYARLDQQGHIYLDYTGGGLYAESQVREHAEMMCNNVFGNPHSHNPTSLAMTEKVESTRSAILNYFNASPDEYTVVFTPNASGALKLIGESYPFRAGGQYALAADNHNSVNGIREFADAKGALVNYLPFCDSDLRLDMDCVRDCLNSAESQADNLLSFPAQSNYSGVKHPLSLVDEAQAKGWDVLLDCAAFAPTNRLDMSITKPDFASFSFYKIFGYPTGVGCLIAKRDKLRKLQRPWFAGGTIQIASVGANDHIMVDNEAAFEDGTVNYLILPAVEIGLRHIESIGIDTITERVHCLTSWLLEEMANLRHENGQPIAHVLGPTCCDDRGGTLSMNLFDPDGIPYSGARLEELAGLAKISLRTGCFCNPGAGEMAFGLDKSFMKRRFEDADRNMKFQDFVSIVRRDTGKELSAIRISVGLVSNFDDVYYFGRFVNALKGISAENLGKVTLRHTSRDTA